MKFIVEQDIIHQLLLRSSMINDVGLFHGKMGLILFFAHYFKHTGHQVYEDTADELMNELHEEINSVQATGFASGLSGIGWGIEYLIQAGFFEADSMEICREIDKKIMERDILRITDYSLDTGLEGILHYILAHIEGVMSQHAILPFDERYLTDVYHVVTTASQDAGLSQNFKHLSTMYSIFYEKRTDPDYSLQLSSFIEDVQIEKVKLNNFPLGLKNGLSGFLLKKLIVN